MSGIGRFSVLPRDGLTGLLSRRALIVALEEKRPSTGALIGIDMDGFVFANAVLGHLVGDRLLRHVADIIATSAPEGATIARFGGDEFVVLIKDAAMADVVADLVRTSVEQAFEAERADIRAGAKMAGVVDPPPGRLLTASVGVARMDGFADRPVEALRAAFEACDRAKRAGGNRVSSQ